ncbi:hypothetical protein HHI36_008240 [Cryptolaemus montrouzieri]|uniref:Uncharacterized protein n=1 Tax=Cryptolaemus montrouzieri TaxID=559131 RepID=A0ABD2MS11_9CUCU
MSSEITALAEKIKILKTDITEQEKYIEQFSKMQKILKELLKKNVGNAEKRNYEIEGNPMLDFTRQMKDNEETIKKLESQNRKFQTILKILEKKNAIENPEY